jgi:type II secretory pathway pseudopilin PulG
MRKVGKWILRIVAAIVALVLVIVAYNYAHEKITGPPPDEANVSDLRSLNTALHTYRSAYGHYPETLQQLAIPAHGPSTDQAAGLLGSKLAAGKIHGYRYSYSRNGDGYAVHGDPDGSDNNVHLFTDESSEIRFQRKRPAEKGSEVLK